MAMMVRVPDRRDNPERYSPPAPPPIDELRASYFRHSVRSAAGMDLANPPPPSSDEDTTSDSRQRIAKVAAPGDRPFGPRGVVVKRKRARLPRRRQLATEYKRLSDELGRSAPIEICAVLCCVEGAVPGHEFCFFHLGFDTKRKGRGKLFHRCTAIIDGQQCCVPCPPGIGRCELHEPQKRVKQKGK
jgi:hypothetical protein